MKKSSPKKSFSKNHQRSWLWGKHAIVEAVKSSRWEMIECVVSIDADEKVKEQIESQCQERNVPFRVEHDARLTELTRAKDHQGFTARMGEYSYLTVEQLLKAKTNKILILDRIQDPYNLGSLIRCAVQFGYDHLLIGEDSQAKVTPHVARSSAGALYHAKICMTKSLSETVTLLKQAEFRIAGTRAQKAVVVYDYQFYEKTGLVIGSEAEGLSAELTKRCDEFICIPMTERIDSLNAAVAGGVIMYEHLRQQNTQNE